MNEVMTYNWNRVVKPGDVVYYDGDFSFRNSPGGKKGEGLMYKPNHYLRQLNGTIVFIEGNHDRNNGLRSLIQSTVIKFGNQEIYMVHDPAKYNPEYPVNFVAHVHTSWQFKRIPHAGGFTDLINVGVDQWNFYPQPIDHILKIYRRWVKKECGGKKPKKYVGRRK